MALSSEDKKDVKGAFGKALANKVSKVTKDNKYRGKLDKSSGARDITKDYKKKNPGSIAHGVHDISRI